MIADRSFAPGGLSVTPPTSAAQGGATRRAPTRAATSGSQPVVSSVWDGLLRRRLRLVHAEAIRQVALVRADPPSYDAAGVGALSPEAGTAQAVTAAKQRIVQLIRDGETEAFRADGERGKQVYAEAAYAMAALVDDLFLATRWPGHDGWAAEPVEARLFGTWMAGDVVFDRIDALLAASADDVFDGLDVARAADGAGFDGAERRAIALVYLAVLALGFEGQYRNVDDKAVRLARYRTRLFELAYGPAALRGNTPPLRFPAAYAATLRGRLPERLASRRQWLAIFLAVVALYLVAGEIVWRVGTKDVRAATACIRELVESPKDRAPASGTLGASTRQSRGDSAALCQTR